VKNIEHGCLSCLEIQCRIDRIFSPMPQPWDSLQISNADLVHDSLGAVCTVSGG
jgi:hypothetical protein